MQVYKKLKVPKDSAFSRRTWRTYAPKWLRNVLDGVFNICRWIPLLYRDRDWDDSYTLVMLQKKIEHQRAYLVNANRHTGVSLDNYWMTVVLNLIERELADYYVLEKYAYLDQDFKFTPCEDDPEFFELTTETTRDDLEQYLVNYRGAARRLLAQSTELAGADNDQISFYVGRYNQERCRKLLFKILEQYSSRWWD